VVITQATLWKKSGGSRRHEELLKGLAWGGLQKGAPQEGSLFNGRNRKGRIVSLISSLQDAYTRAAVLGLRG